jgi:hypothetical protein
MNNPAKKFSPEVRARITSRWAAVLRSISDSSSSRSFRASFTGVA